MNGVIEMAGEFDCQTDECQLTPTLDPSPVQQAQAESLLIVDYFCSCRKRDDIRPGSPRGRCHAEDIRARPSEKVRRLINRREEDFPMGNDQGGPLVAFRVWYDDARDRR